VEPSMFIQKWITTTDISMSSQIESTDTHQKKAVLYDYLVALNKDISCLDEHDALQPPECASSSTTTVPQKNSPKYMDMEDSQDPYADIDDHYINWEGCGLFWDIPFSEEYYRYHNQ
jgi:hypothetical protein